MTGISRAFVESGEVRGLCVGILPADPDDPDSGRPPAGYPNPWVELALPTHLSGRGERGDAADSRNHLVVLAAHAVVALPGAAGTRSEVGLALRYGRPVVAFLPDPSALDPLPPEVPVVSSSSGAEAWLASTLDRPRRT